MIKVNVETDRRRARTIDKIEGISVKIKECVVAINLLALNAIRTLFME